MTPEEIQTELSRKLDYCDEQWIEVSNHFVKGNWAEARESIDNMIPALKECARLLTVLSKNKQ